MTSIYADNSLTIGKTPLVQLHRVTEGCQARVLAKIEGRNPAFSQGFALSRSAFRNPSAVSCALCKGLCQISSASRPPVSLRKRPTFRICRRPLALSGRPASGVPSSACAWRIK